MAFIYLFIYFEFELRDDRCISYGSFMRTKHLYVSIHIRIKNEVATVKLV